MSSSTGSGGINHRTAWHNAWHAVPLSGIVKVQLVYLGPDRIYVFDVSASFRAKLLPRWLGRRRRTRGSRSAQLMVGVTISVEVIITVVVYVCLPSQNL